MFTSAGRTTWDIALLLFPLPVSGIGFWGALTGVTFGGIKLIALPVMPLAMITAGAVPYGVVMRWPPVRAVTGLQVLRKTVYTKCNGIPDTTAVEPPPLAVLTVLVVTLLHCFSSPSGLSSDPVGVLGKVASRGFLVLGVFAVKKVPPWHPEMEVPWDGCARWRVRVVEGCVDEPTNITGLEFTGNYAATAAPPILALLNFIRGSTRGRRSFARVTARAVELHAWPGTVAWAMRLIVLNVAPTFVNDPLVLPLVIGSTITVTWSTVVI
jgi:hypothetical protein